MSAQLVPEIFEALHRIETKLDQWAAGFSLVAEAEEILEDETED